jgi:hypothetical protein
MRTIVSAASVLALSLSLCACATVTRGTSTKYTMDSTPGGAAVKTSSGFSCAATPCTLKLPRKEAFDATFTKAGYKSQTVHVKSEVRGGGAAGFVGNAVAGGLLGMAIDGSDGAMNDLVPSSLKVTLVANDAPATNAAPAAAPASAPAPAAPAAASPSTGG